MTVLVIKCACYLRLVVIVVVVIVIIVVVDENVVTKRLIMFVRLQRLARLGQAKAEYSCWFDCENA